MLKTVFAPSVRNRPGVDVPEGRLPAAQPVGVQGPGEGEEERGGERHRPAGERSAQDGERGRWRTNDVITPLYSITNLPDKSNEGNGFKDSK